MGTCIEQSKFAEALALAGGGGLRPSATPTRSLHPALALLVPPILDDAAIQQYHGQVARMQPIRICRQKCAENLIIQRVLGTVSDEEIAATVSDSHETLSTVYKGWANASRLYDIDRLQVLQRNTLNELIDLRYLARLAADGYSAGIVSEPNAKGILCPETALVSAISTLDAITNHFRHTYMTTCRDEPIFPVIFSPSKSGIPRVTLYGEFLAVHFDRLFDGVDSATANSVRKRLANISHFLRPLGLPDAVLNWSEPLDGEYFESIDEITMAFKASGIDSHEYEAHFDTILTSCDQGWITDFSEYQHFASLFEGHKSVATLWSRIRKHSRQQSRKPLSRTRKSKRALALLAWCEQVDAACEPYREADAGAVPYFGLELLNIIILPELVEHENSVQALFEMHMNGGDEDDGFELLDDIDLDAATNFMVRLAAGDQLIRALIDVDSQEY